MSHSKRTCADKIRLKPCYKRKRMHYSMQVFFLVRSEHKTNFHSTIVLENITSTCSGNETRIKISFSDECYILHVRNSCVFIFRWVSYNPERVFLIELGRVVYRWMHFVQFHDTLFIAWRYFDHQHLICVTIFSPTVFLLH